MLEYIMVTWNLGLTILVVLLIHCQSNQADLLSLLNHELLLLRGDDGK